MEVLGKLLKLAKYQADERQRYVMICTDFTAEIHLCRLFL